MDIIKQLVFLEVFVTGCRPTRDDIVEIALCYNTDKDWISWQQRLVPKNKAAKHYFPSDKIDSVEFAEIANDLAELLSDKIIVSHRAYLKWSFLQQAFKENQIVVNAKIICLTKLVEENLQLLNSEKCVSAQLQVKHYQKIFFSLTKCCDETSVQQLIKQQTKIAKLPAGLIKQDIDQIPNRPGIYFFYGVNNALLYVGKSSQLKKRILSHFTAAANNNKEMRMMQQIKKIDWLETVGELAALLQESQYVKSLLPLFNRRLRKRTALFSITAENVSQENYLAFAIADSYEIKTGQEKLQSGLFRSKRQAIAALRSIVKENNLCLKLAGLDLGKTACFFHQIHQCFGACVGKEPAESYNQRALDALKKFFYKTWPYAGCVAIKETCYITQRKIFHLVDEWSYLGSVEDLANVNKFKENLSQLPFDLDIYQILKFFFEKKLLPENIILLY